MSCLPNPKRLETLLYLLERHVRSHRGEQMFAVAFFPLVMERWLRDDPDDAGVGGA